MIDKLRQKYESLDPERRQQVAKIAFIMVLIAFATFLYYSRDKKPEPQKQPETTFKEIQPRLGYLEKSLYYETTSRVEALEKKIDELTLQLKALSQEVSKEKEQKSSEVFREIENLRKQVQTLKSAEISSSAYRVPPPPGSPSGSEQQLPRRPRIIGDIGTTQLPEAEGRKTSQKTEKESKKEEQKEESVYLPPSFVEADLISGFAAPTMEAAKSEPIRTFLRLRDLAILPNEVKQDLKGCFVIAEGYGNLADERAHLRLLRLSCITRDGASVIDEKVKGFVVDEDGKIGLRGRVVTKAGAMLARSFVAGFLEGFGNAYGQSAYTLSTTAAGQVQTLNPSEAARAGIGSGIAKGASSISKFYLDMARQAFPVIEIGAGKKVVVVFDEGVELHIKKHCLGGRDGCNKDKELFVLSNL